MSRTIRFDLSRYKFNEPRTDSDGFAYLPDREPIIFEERDDNIPHIVQDGDKLWSLAQFYYWDLDVDAAQLWYVIAEYQPRPIVNPFKPLKPGSLLHIPSPEMVEAEIINAEVEVFQ